MAGDNGEITSGTNSYIKPDITPGVDLTKITFGDSAKEQEQARKVVVDAQKKQAEEAAKRLKQQLADRMQNSDAGDRRVGPRT